MIRRVWTGLVDVEASAAAGAVAGLRAAAAWFEGLTGWRRLAADFLLLWLICLAAIGEFVGLWYVHH